MQSDHFEEAVVKSTKASWGSSGYSVELFPDVTWRVLWNNEIGNCYKSPGVILSIPPFDDSDYQDLVANGDMPEDDWFFEAFLNEKDEIAKDLRDRLSDREVMCG